MKEEIGVGDNISHETFGKGKVLNVIDENTLWVEFGTNRIMVKPIDCEKLN